MKWLKQYWRGTVRVFAVLLVCVGGFFGHWWFYKLGPARRTLDLEWYNAHSEREYWREVQKGIHRGTWLHDDGFTVGMYGDKSWAEWIMAHVKPGTSMGCLGGRPYHSATSMRYITNQDVGEEADAWLAWWEENKSQSQEEWMADGFRRRGFEIDVPPTPAQFRVLLEVLGDSETNELTAIPREMKYNAFRCLRDSGFEPVAYMLSNRTVTAEIESGLLEYAKQERHWPSAMGVGILPFGKSVDDWGDMPLPAVTTIFQVTANALVFGPPLLGVVLLICSFRRTRKNVEPSPRPYSEGRADEQPLGSTLTK